MNPIKVPQNFSGEKFGNLYLLGYNSSFPDSRFWVDGEGLLHCPSLDFQPDLSTCIASPQEQGIIEFSNPVKAPDFIVATPAIDPDPNIALQIAIEEFEMGEGNPKSIYVIAAGIVSWIKANKNKIDKLK